MATYPAPKPTSKSKKASSTPATALVAPPEKPTSLSGLAHWYMVGQGMSEHDAAKTIAAERPDASRRSIDARCFIQRRALEGIFYKSKAPKAKNTKNTAVPPVPNQAPVAPNADTPAAQHAIKENCKELIVQYLALKNKVADDEDGVRALTAKREALVALFKKANPDNELVKYKGNQYCVVENFITTADAADAADAEPEESIPEAFYGHQYHDIG